MNKIILFLGFIFATVGNSQDLSEYKNILSELNTPSNALNIEFTVPNSHSNFYIVIENDIIQSRYIGIDPCAELKSDFEINYRIQNILNKLELLNYVYVLIEDELIQLDPNDKVNFDLILFFINIEYEFKNQTKFVSIPIFDKITAEMTISELNDLFPNEKCYSELLERQ
jgi:hypothetical protein